MLRTALNKAYLKRTIRPLYGWTQATPKSAFLDPAWNRATAIWPGMVLAQQVSPTGGETWTLAANSGNTAQLGLSGLYIGGDGIDEPLESGINAIAVWILGPDAEFEILAPAYDTTAITTATAPGTLLGIGSGKLNTAGTQKVCKLIGVADATKIIVGGLTGTTA